MKPYDLKKELKEIEKSIRKATKKGGLSELPIFTPDNFIPSFNPFLSRAENNAYQAHQNRIASALDFIDETISRLERLRLNTRYITR